MKLSTILIICLSCYFVPCHSFDCKNALPHYLNWTSFEEGGTCFGYGRLVNQDLYTYGNAQKFCERFNGKLASISTARLRLIFGEEIKYAIKYETVYTVFDESEAFFWVDLTNRSGIVSWGDGRSFKQAISDPKSPSPNSYVSRYIVLNGDFEAKIRFYNEYRSHYVRNAICELEERKDILNPVEFSVKLLYYIFIYSCQYNYRR